MREEIGVLLVEVGGHVSVQLFDKAGLGKISFDNFVKLEDTTGRATYISIDYRGNSAKVEAKDMPVGDDPEKRPDGIVLGQGPIWLPEKEEDKDAKADSAG